MDVTLDFVNVAICVLLSGSVLFAYALGHYVGGAEARDQAVRVRRNVDRSR
jgi:hypothetical protein